MTTFVAGMVVGAFIVLAIVACIILWASQFDDPSDAREDIL